MVALLAAIRAEARAQPASPPVAPAPPPAAPASPPVAPASSGAPASPPPLVAPAPPPASAGAALASVRLVPPACPTPPVDVIAFLALLRIELATDGIASVDAAGDGAGASLATIALEVVPCAADAREVLVTIDDAATRKSVRRAVHLGDVVPSGRPRALALAVAELLRASWAELAMPSVPPPTAPVPAALREGVQQRAAAAGSRGSGSVEVRPLPPPRPAYRPGRYLSGALESRALLASGSGLVGGRLGSSFPLGARVRLSLDAGALYGTATDPLGDVEITLVSGRAGVALASETESLSAALGPRLELGWGHAEGRPFEVGTRGDSGGAFVATTSLAASLRVRLVDRWWALIEPEVGGVLRGFRARADERAPAGVTGALAGVGVGIALRL